MLTSSAVCAFVLADVLFSYLTSHNYDFQCVYLLFELAVPFAIPTHHPLTEIRAFAARSYDKTHNVRPKRNIRMAMQHEVSMYAIAQKEG